MELRKLVLASQAGDMDSYIRLIRQKEAVIYRVARVYTRNSFDAEDCVSEAVLLAYDRIRQLRNADKFYVWFLSILINLCRKKYRFSTRELEYIPEVHDGLEDDLVHTAENLLLVENILTHLKSHEREILVLRYLKDFSLEETAEMLGIPEGTVKSRLNRTIAKIKWRYGRLFSNEIG